MNELPSFSEKGKLEGKNLSKPKANILLFEIETLGS